MHSRATIIYLAMLALFGVGLWAILSVGSIWLRAPEDLSGQWQVHALDAGADDIPLLTMSIEQSGKFFKLTIQDRGYDLKLTDQTRVGADGSPRTTMHLVGNLASATFQGTPGGDEYSFHFDGPIRGAWRAVRTRRTYKPSPPQTNLAPAPSTHARGP